MGEEQLLGLPLSATLTATVSPCSRRPHFSFQIGSLPLSKCSSAPNSPGSVTADARDCSTQREVEPIAPEPSGNR